MKLPVLRDLTLPTRASTTARALFSLAVAQAIEVARRLPGRTTTSALYRARVLEPLQRERGLLAWSMTQPSRMSFARCLALAGTATAEERAAWEDELAAALAFDAVRAGIVGELTLSAPPRRFVCERDDVAYDVPRGAAATLRRESVWVDGAPLEARPAAVRVFADAKLLLVDQNPLAELEAHPDKHGNALSLGGKPASDWVASLRASFEIVDAYLPEVAREMRLVLRHLVPVGWDDERHLSASFLEAVGVIYLTLHPDLMTMVEALVHEFQHTKLNLMLGFDPLLENGMSPLFSSPVRPDPRPLRGVVLAVHAFQPIARLYERMIADGKGTARIEARLRQIAQTCRAGCDVVLPNAQPTPRGAALFAEMAALDEELSRHLSA